MKLIIRIIIFTLILYLSFHNTFCQDICTTKDFIISSNSVGKAELGMQISVLYEVYNDCTFSDVSLWEYGIHSENTGILISKENIPLMFVWKKQDEITINGIFVLSNSFKIKNKISVGSSITDILSIFPDSKIKRDCLNEDEEYIFVKEINALLIFKTTKDSRVGHYNTQDCEEVSNSFDTTRTIDLIHIKL